MIDIPTTTDPIIGPWIVVAVEEDGETIELSDYEEMLGLNRAPFRDMRLMFFEDFTGFISNGGNSEDVIWASAGHGLYALYDANNESIKVEIYQQLLFLDLDTADFTGTLVFEKNELTIEHFD